MTENEQLHIFNEWIGLHKGLIFKIVRSYARTDMDRDDLFQEIVIQVWRSIPQFRQESAVVTWLYRVSLNIAIKWARKEQRTPHTDALDGMQHLLQENRGQRDERLDWLYKEIHQLNEIDRSIALLLLDGFSYKEMAVIAGITESNIGVRINRIKKQLITKSKSHDYHGV